MRRMQAVRGRGEGGGGRVPARWLQPERIGRTDRKNANNKTFAKHRLALYDPGGGERGV